MIDTTGLLEDGYNQGVMLPLDIFSMIYRIQPIKQGKRAAEKSPQHPPTNSLIDFYANAGKMHKLTLGCKIWMIVDFNLRPNKIGEGKQNSTFGSLSCFL